MWRIRKECHFFMKPSYGQFLGKNDDFDRIIFLGRSIGRFFDEKTRCIIVNTMKM